MTAAEIALQTGADSQIIEWLLYYRYWGLFVGAIFLSESFIFTTSFLAEYGFWTLGAVFIFNLAGTLIGDAFWFFFGRKFLGLANQWKIYENIYAGVSKILNKIADKNILLSIITMRFMYGTRFLMIIYFSTRQLSFARFLFYNLVASILWLSVLIFIGWLAGRGVYNFIHIYMGISYTIFALIVCVIIFNLIYIGLRKHLSRKIEKNT